MRKLVLSVLVRLLMIAALVALVLWITRIERPERGTRIEHPPENWRQPGPPPGLDVVHWQLPARTQTQGCDGNRDMPDPQCTPGAVFANATTQEVCVPYYTKRVRNVPRVVRKEAFAAYGIPLERASEYELDHHVPLALGGSNDIANLWPEAYDIPDGARTKDVVESYLYRQVCKGNITLSEAQYRIATDWKAVAREMPPPKRRKK